MYSNGQDTDINDLIELNMPIVHDILNRRFTAHRFDEDYIQEGRIGLWKAIKTYDSSKGYSFSTYAYRVIQNQIQYAYRQSEERRRSQYEVFVDSIDKIVSDEDQSISLEDRLPANIDIIEEAISNIHVRDVMTKLTEEELKVFKYLHEGYTQRKIGEMLGRSQPWVSHRLKKIAKLLEG